MMPWYVWCAVAAVTSAMVGAHWDISWHRSIGRDTFWTPAHIAIYSCGLLAGLASGYQILHTTFSGSPEAKQARTASVRIWGFRGPLGAFVMAWGGIAMLTSGPFDDWWHNAYGLDVRIISPPHTVLAMGVFSVLLGTVLLIAGRMNRSKGAERRALEHVYIYLGGLVLVNMATFIMESIFTVAMHSGFFYKAVALAIPLYMVLLSRASGLAWPATRMAAVYMTFWAGINWILPLFPAEPKLGPVLNPVDHFVPSYFPLLLVAPGVAVDVILSRTGSWPEWMRAAAAGVAFTAAVVAVQWPFGHFLLSPAADNWFFYAAERDYRTGPDTYSAKRLFLPPEASFAGNMIIAFAAAPVMSWIGLHWSAWLSKVRR